MQVIAHRGASQELPENSLAAFARALEIGVDALEGDVLVTKDHQLVVVHDDLITQGGRTHYIHELTFEELQRIDLGGGERIPSVEMLLERFQDECEIILDLKTSGTAELLIPLLLKRPTQHNLHVSSFLHAELLPIHRECPAVARSITLAAMPIHFDTLFQDSQTAQVNLFRACLHEATMRQLHALGVRVLVYPVNLPREAARFAQWGVDGIYTDDPAAMQAFRTAG